MKELFNRLSLKIDRLKNQKSKNTYTYLFFIMLIITVIFTATYIKIKRDRAVKENIIESLMAVQEEKSDDRIDDISEKEVMMVYICGAVAAPGVYEVKKEDRIIDLLKMAGGPAANACAEALNLAKKLSDGEKIYVPTHEEASLGNYKSSFQKESTVNINTATITELSMLPGIGPSIASNIVSYRESKGFFESIEQIKDVKGIGDKKFEDIKDLISN